MNSIRLIYGLLFLAPSLPSESKNIKLQNVHIIKSMNVKVINDHYEQMMSSLKRMNIDTATLKKNTFDAQSNTKNIDKYLSSLNQKPELIISMATLASKYLHKYGQQNGIPVFFVTVSQPIEAGLIKNFDGPTKTLISGVSHTLPVTKIVGYITQMARKKLKSGPIRFSYVHSSYPSEVGFGNRLTIEFQKNPRLTLKKRSFMFRPGNHKKMLADYSKLVKEMDNKTDFFLLPIGPSAIIPGFTKRLISLSKKPVLFTSHQQGLEEGALMLVDSNSKEVGRLAATNISKLLKGESIGTIKPEKVESVRLGMNIKKAKELKFPIPSDLLRQSINNLVK